MLHGIHFSRISRAERNPQSFGNSRSSPLEPALCDNAHKQGNEKVIGGLVAVDGFDPLRDEGVSYAEALQAAETVVDFRPMNSLTHRFASLFARRGGSATAKTELISALRAHLTRD